MRGPRRPEPHTLAGAYALDAITGPDQARFERHLARCQACAAELRELREATARLAGAVAADPPADLIRRAVAAAARTRQLPPVTDRASAGPTARLAGLAHLARLGRGGAGTRPVTGPGRLRRAVLGVAVACLAVATASGTVALTAENHLGTARLSEHAITGVLNAPDAVLLTSRVKGGGTATVVMSRRDRSLVFTTAGLPALPVGRCYQLWLMGPTGDRPVDVLPAPEQGMTSPVLATGLAEGDWVGLTIEPTGHSGHTASRPILMLSLAA